MKEGKSLILILVLVASSVFFIVRNLSNGTYYRSANGVVMAATSKRLWSFKKAVEFSNLSIGSSNGYFYEYFEHFYVKTSESDTMDLGSIENSDDLKYFLASSEDEIYKPLHFPPEVMFFEHASGIALILDSEWRVLRVSFNSTSSSQMEIGINRVQLKKVPISISNLEDLFGRGEWYNNFTM